jgi:hypothetical protein
MTSMFLEEALDGNTYRGSSDYHLHNWITEILDGNRLCHRVFLREFLCGFFWSFCSEQSRKSFLCIQLRGASSTWILSETCEYRQPETDGTQPWNRTESSHGSFDYAMFTSIIPWLQEFCMNLGGTVAVTVSARCFPWVQTDGVFRMFPTFPTCWANFEWNC